MESTVCEAEKFLIVFCKLQDVIGKEEVQDLRKMLQYCEKFFPEFSAAGFFSVNKGLILSLIDNVVTYFIIILQVNANQSQN